MPLSTADREDVVHHGLPVAEVVLIAETDEASGLATHQWRERLAALGPNELPAQRGPSWVMRLLGWQPWLVLSVVAYVLVELEKWRQRHAKGR